MPFPMFPNFNLKPPAEEEKRPRPRLVLRLPEEEIVIEPYPLTTLQHLVSIAPSICGVFAAAWIFYGLVSVLDSPDDNHFTWLWSNGTRFLRGNEVCLRNLPPELLGKIGKHLASRLDILRFRSVCKRLRSSLPSPTRFPLMVPSPPSSHPHMCYFITELNIYSNKGNKFMAFEEVGQGGKFCAHYVYPSKVKCDFHMISQISFVAKGYHLRMALPRFEERAQGQWEFHDQKVAEKTVLICAECVNPSYARASDLSVVAHLSRGEMRGRLALLWLGGPPEKWAWDTDFCSEVFEAISTYKGQLCMLDQFGRVYLMDYNFLQMTQVGPPFSIAREMGRKHLFEARGDLYLAIIKKPQRIEAYKLSLRYQKWIKAPVSIRNQLPALVHFIV